MNVNLQTELVRMGNELQEDALSGRCEKAVVLYVGPGGKVDISAAGLSNFELLGVLSVVQITVQKFTMEAQP